MRGFMAVLALLSTGACALGALSQALQNSDRAYFSPSPPRGQNSPDLPVSIYLVGIMENRPGSAARFEGAIRRKLPLPDLNRRLNSISGPILENPEGTAVRAEFQKALAPARDGSKLFIWNIDPLRLLFSRYQFEAGIDAVATCDLTSLFQNDLQRALETAPRYNPDFPIEVTWQYAPERELFEQPLEFVGWADGAQIVASLEAEMRAVVTQGAAEVLNRAGFRNRRVYLTYAYRASIEPTCSATEPSTVADPEPIHSLTVFREAGKTDRIRVDGVTVTAFPTTNERPDLATPLFFAPGINAISGPFR